MKKLTLIALVMFLLVLSSIAVSAALVPAETFSATNPMFGSKNQEASNPNAESEVNQEIFVTKTLTLTNTGTSSVTINTSSITVTPASGFTLTSTDLIKGINISVVTEKTIAAGATKTPIELTMPARYAPIVGITLNVLPAIPVSIKAAAATKNAVVSFSLTLRKPTTNPSTTRSNTR